MGKKEYQAPDRRQQALLRRHGLEWRNYLVKRELNTSIFLLDRRNGTVKIIDKN